MKNSLLAAKIGKIVLLHACTHNPTGVDPSTFNGMKLPKFAKKNKFYHLLIVLIKGNTKNYN
jgi:aspartate/tyrosine/aromatic aminotransferase